MIEKSQISRKLTLLHMLEYIDREYYKTKIDKYLKINGILKLYCDYSYEESIMEDLLDKKNIIEERIEEIAGLLSDHFEKSNVEFRFSCNEDKAYIIFCDDEHNKVNADIVTHYVYADINREYAFSYPEAFTVVREGVYSVYLFPILKFDKLKDSYSGKYVFDLEKELQIILESQNKDLARELFANSESFFYKNEMGDILDPHSLEALYIKFIQFSVSEFALLAERLLSKGYDDKLNQFKDDFVASFVAEVIGLPKSLERLVKAKRIP